MSLFPHAELAFCVHRADALPRDDAAEVGFAGRSNAGKSSAINALLGRRKLAYVSKAPGRTQSLNFIRLDARRFVVDMPGYGYAAVDRQTRGRWSALMEHYLLERDSLRGLVLVSDARHPLTALDQQLVAWFARTGKPLHVLLTKADKLKRAEAARALREAGVALARENAQASVQLFSSVAGTGLNEARRVLHGWLK